MHEKTVAYCGLICDSCPVYLATIEKDKVRQRAMKESIARLCQTKYGMNLGPEDISDCEGCLTDSGSVFSGCLQCEIRACVRRKHIANCAYCSVYPCTFLKEHFKHDPEAGVRLENIRKSGTV